MSKVESLATASPSPQYLAWLQRQRRGHLLVRGTQVAILVDPHCRVQCVQ